MGALERIGAEVRRKFDTRIEQMLFSEQRPLYADWKRRKAEAAAAGAPR
jgi:hypothetical protein